MNGNNKDNNKTQRDIGKLEGKVEMMISTQANYEQKRETDVKQIFGKIDGMGREMRGVISKGNERIHKRLDDNIKEMKDKNEQQDEEISKLKVNNARKLFSIGGSSGVGGGALIYGLIEVIKSIFTSGGG